MTTKLLIITDDPQLAAMKLAPQPARLWTNFAPDGKPADFENMRLDPCIMPGQTCDIATFDRIAAETGMVYWQDCFGVWKNYNAPPKLSDRYLRTYRRALQDFKARSASDAKLLITDFEGLSADKDGYLRHDSREEQPWLFAVGRTWSGKSGNYNVVRNGPTGKETGTTTRGKNFVWPEVEVSCPICYDNGMTPGELDECLLANERGAVVFVRPQLPLAANFCNIARAGGAAYVVLFAAAEAGADELARIREATAAVVKGW